MKMRTCGRSGALAAAGVLLLALGACGDSGGGDVDLDETGVVDDTTDSSENINDTFLGEQDTDEPDLVDDTPDDTGLIDDTADDTPIDDPASPTFHADVLPILDAHCNHCHAAGGIGPFALGTYAEAQPWAWSIVDSVQAGRMPPWGAVDTDECTPTHPWANDPRPSQAAIDTLAAWLDAGAPEGDPADAPADGGPPPLAEVPYDIELEPPPQVVEQGPDDFRCLVLDPGFTEDTWISSVGFVPGDDEVVHHLLLYTDPSHESLGHLGGEDYYPCFGGPKVNPTELIAGWAPGGDPVQFPDGVATLIPAGSLLVLQVHYSPQQLAMPTVDVTKVRLGLHDGEPEYLTAALLLGNLDDEIINGLGIAPGVGGETEFVIPPGASDHVETMHWSFYGDEAGPYTEMAIYGVLPHMHLLGKDIKVDVHRKAPDEGACTADEMDPLLACFLASCIDLPESEWDDCTIDTCADSWNALQMSCALCLADPVGDDLDEVIAYCSDPPADPVYDPAVVPQEECLVHVPAWDFSWQRNYAYDAPIEQLPMVRPGDLMTIRCTYDNTLDNPAVADALDALGFSEPQAVSLGDNTIDEMCLVGLQVIIER